MQWKRTRSPPEHGLCITVSPRLFTDGASSHSESGRSWPEKTDRQQDSVYGLLMNASNRFFQRVDLLVAIHLSSIPSSSPSLGVWASLLCEYGQSC